MKMAVSFEKYTNYNPESGVDTVRFGSDAPVLDVELNEIQEILKDRIGFLIKGVLGNSLLGTSITLTPTTISLTGGFAFCNGKTVQISSLTAPLELNSLVLLRIKESDVDPYETLYKYGNEQESKVFNHSIDNRLQIVTSKRKVLHYNLITAPIDSALMENDILIAKAIHSTTPPEYVINTFNGRTLVEFLSSLKEEIESVISNGSVEHSETSGYSDTAGKWKTERNLALAGHLAGNVNIDGSKNITLNATLTDTIINFIVGIVVDSAPTALNTLKKISAAINNDPTYSTGVANDLKSKAPLSSPALTGTPTCPNVSVGTSSSQLANAKLVYDSTVNIKSCPIHIQTSAPTGNSNSLWINPSNGVAYYWNGKWNPISGVAVS